MSTPDLRQRIADEIDRLYDAGAIYAIEDSERDALAAALLPLFAEERAAGRRDGLREGASAIQVVIDRDKTRFPAHSNSRVALGGARQILLGLIAPPAPIAGPSPVCQGFVWIGQPLAHCERCDQPAWAHAGEEVLAEGAGPFDGKLTVRPWRPGEADRLRQRTQAKNGDR